MKRFLVIISVLAFIGFVTVVFTGFYPVAVVNGLPIFYSTWKKAENASIRFKEAQSQSANGKTVDLFQPENQELLLETSKDTLTYLIEDRILQDAGKKIIDAFPKMVRQYAQENIGNPKDLERGVKELYGLSFNDFTRLVILPQARRDLIREELKKRGQDFEEWFRSVKEKAKVSLMFVSFRWDGERVR